MKSIQPRPQVDALVTGTIQKAEQLAIETGRQFTASEIIEYAALVMQQRSICRRAARRRALEAVVKSREVVE